MNFKTAILILFSFTVLQIKCSVVPIAPPPPPLRYTLVAPQNIRPFAAQVSTFTRGLNVFDAPLAAGVLNPPAIFARNVAFPPVLPAPIAAPAPVLAGPGFPASPVPAPVFAGPGFAASPVPAPVLAGPGFAASPVPAPVLAGPGWPAPAVPTPVLAGPGYPGFLPGHLAAYSAPISAPLPAPAVPAPVLAAPGYPGFLPGHLARYSAPLPAPLAAPTQYYFPPPNAPFYPVPAGVVPAPHSHVLPFPNARSVHSIAPAIPPVGVPLAPAPVVEPGVW